jgi:CubicO group peptidase (beta-lactamase class C family)
VIALLFCGIGLPEAKIIDADVQAALKFWQVPGVAIALVAGDKTYIKGYGVRRAGEPAAVDGATLFSLSSCSKAFTVAAMSDLVAQGKMDWDDPVGKYLKGFSLHDPWVSREVTLRDLLCHRTGMGGHELLWYRSPLSPRQAIEALGKLPLDHRFRTTFRYQNTLYTAAGLAAAAADNTTWPELIRKRVLQPLEMADTLLDTPSAEKTNRLASTHQLDEDNQLRPMPPFRWVEGDAAGSIYSCANDMAKWVRFQLTSSERVQESHTPQIVLRDTDLDAIIFPQSVQRSYGLGWVIYDHRGNKWVAHGGATDGFRCHIALAPKHQVGVAVLANLDQTPLPAALASRLLERMLEQEPGDWNDRFRTLVERIRKARYEAQTKRLTKAREGKPLDPNRYVGEYTHPAYGTVRLSVRGGRLRVRWREEDGPAEALGAGTFFFHGELLGQAILTFDKQERFSFSTIPGVLFQRSEP